MTPFEIAQSFIGEREIPGSQHNPRILDWFERVGHDWVKDDETAWCAAFAGAMLDMAGLPHTGKLNARSYDSWGEKVSLQDALPGDIVVFWRGDPNGWQGHVGFYVSHDARGILVLGGNQGNEVSQKYYSTGRLISVRRMAGLQPVRKHWLAVLVNTIMGLFRGRRTP